MVDSTIVGARYKYVHDGQKEPLEVIDAHHVFVLRNASTGFFVKIFCLLIVVANSLFFILLKEKSTTTILCILLLLAVFIKLFFGRHVVKESVIIMPSFGIQLETHYQRGKTTHRFIPISKILKPMLNECVTPVTCYWSLALLLRDEDQLLLVFKELHPPVKMLIPIWKALCSATDAFLALSSTRTATIDSR
jgi:phosphatidylinositol glycan class H protein